ncbi:YdeI/OmpD-associated family protein [Streptomyces sp. HPF1205]|uniref:YdeI/OmpD-associated family protein n=1 Tax=Streptomyces sp. HPF1205 TaxID=2873262 RepID=UPI0021F181E2|nr:YdeI/OmpD-associated family protein [Streptomyces sp. HPF1205]
MSDEEFQGTLVCEGVGAWTYVPVPAEVAERLGGKARIPVAAEIKGVSFTGSVMTGPQGSRYLVVNQAVRDRAGVTAGDTVNVVVRQDTAPRVVELPEDLAGALAAAPEAQAAFDGFSYSRRKEYVTWIESAKRPETRTRRVEKAVEMLAEGRALKG